MINLDSEFREQWLAALRSGDYAQTRAVLYSDGEDGIEGTPGYCCLGVACSILGVPDYAMMEVILPQGIKEAYLGNIKSLKNTISVPCVLDVNRWIKESSDFKNEDPQIDDLFEEESYRIKEEFQEYVSSKELFYGFLAFLNDQGWNFCDIADVIEQNTKPA